MSFSVPPVLKVLLPLALIVAILLKARSWRLDLREDRRGPWDFTVWRQQTLLVSAMRVAGGEILMHVAWNLFAVW